MTWTLGGHSPPGPDGPAPFTGVFSRSLRIREALLVHDRNLRLGKPPPVSWVGARIAAHARHRELTDMLIDLALRTAVNFVGLFAKPERPRHKVPD